VKANAALQYHVDGFDMTGRKPMGRQSAGFGLLRGFIEHADIDEVVGYGEDARMSAPFEAAVRKAGSARPVRWLTGASAQDLRRVGALHLGGPLGPDLAFERRAVDQRAWSLTGVTHTVASDRVLAALADLASAPIQSWDAQICTSRAVRGVVETVLSDQEAYLRARFGDAIRFTRPQTPVIPLGVRCADFSPDASARTRLRQRLGVPDDAVLVLMAARLSFHAKAHPHPMYVALQAAAKATGRETHLLLASWFNDEHQEAVFREGAAELCPDIKLHVVDGREPGAWAEVWQAGDVYTLLSDNIQESFGISPVEAMAAGLPVVGADWNGLKDTVEPGVTGFLPRTYTPPPGAGGGLADAYHRGTITYDQYIGSVAQSTAIDVPETTAAYQALLADADLRRRMGEAGRARAKALFDWSAVIPQYQALWAELAERRRIDKESAPLSPGQPNIAARSDPYHHFSGYPTRALRPEDRLVVPADFTSRLAAASTRRGTKVTASALSSGAEMQALSAQLAAASGDIAVSEVATGDRGRRSRVLRTLLWMVKHDILRIAPA
jgi:glycosyltransferase involved in cell wall biosynthesis